MAVLPRGSPCPCLPLAGRVLVDRIKHNCEKAPSAQSNMREQKGLAEKGVENTACQCMEQMCTTSNSFNVCLGLLGGSKVAND